MRPKLVTRLKEEWNNLDPVDPLRGLIADAIDALVEQPAQQQQQEPYGWKVYGINSLFMGEFAEADAKAEAKRIGGTCIAFPLYTSPQTQRQPLPAHEIVTMYDESPTGDSDMIAFARAIEAAHGITKGKK